MTKIHCDPGCHVGEPCPDCPCVPFDPIVGHVCDLAPAAKQHTWQATIGADDKRAELWLEAYGRLSVPIVSPILEAVNLPGRGAAATYQLDVDAIDGSSLARLVLVLAGRFDLSIDDAMAELATNGVPIVADGVRVSTTCCDSVPANRDEELLDVAASDRAGSDWRMPDLGPCCACPAIGPIVRNILMLPQKSPTPGRGWGCLLPGCNLPQDGAVAVVCDPCLESKAPLISACRGWPGEADGRVPIGELVGEQVHDEVAHRADEILDPPDEVLVEDECFCDGEHRRCHYCGEDAGCMPVLMWQEAASGRPEDLEEWAVCDPCLAKHHRFGPITRMGGR